MSLINTFFISTATFVNTSIFLVIVCMWMVNRQFHFKQHSYEKPPLQPLKRARTSLRHARRSIKSRMMLKKRGGGGDDDDDDNSTLMDAVAEIEGDEQKSLLDKEELLQRNYKSFQSFLVDVDFQGEDDDEEEDDGVDSRHDNDVIMEETNENEEQDGPTPWRNIFTLNPTKDLLHLASKIEVFSYLSPAAVRHVLKYVEYLDFANVGDVVFNRDTLDGSMYCVVSGEVATTLMIESKRGDFSFVSPPGEVITSLLTIVTSLIQEYQHQDGSLPSFPESGKVVLPGGMDCNCIVSKPNTRLLKIPARCFVTILEKFPQDVHRICQTIVARLQRVTIQTLVRFLGLGQEVLGLSQRQDDGDASSQSDFTPLKTPRKTDVFTRFEESLKSEVSYTEESLLNQATIAVASLLGLSAEETDVLREGVSITTASPMSTIIRSGEQPKAVYVILKGSLEVGLEENDAQVNNVSVDTGEGWKAKARRTKNVSSTPRTEEGHGGQTTAFKPLFRSSPGAFLGMFSCFTHEANLVTIRNATEDDAIILKIPTNTFDLITSKHPRALIHCLSGIIDTLGGGRSLCVSPAMFLLDWTLDWMHVESGEYIAIEGEKCDSMFVVLNGRLRAGERATTGSRNVDALPKSSDISHHEEFGRGATIGELEALVEGRWRSSVYASRHCEVARIPVGLLSVLMEMFPSAGIRFAKSIAAQVCSRKGVTSILASSSPSLLPSYALSLATIAVVPLSSNVDVREFCQTLTSSLECIAPTKLLTKKETKERVGEEFFRHPNAMLKVKMTRILGDVSLFTFGWPPFLVNV
jgi:CRP-like cAMP-binding protein